MGCSLIDFSGLPPKFIWKSKVFASHFSSFIYKAGYLYGNDGDAISGGGIFRCIEFETGKIKWSVEKKIGSLLCIGDKFVLLDQRGRIYVAQMQSNKYNEIAQSKLKRAVYWTAPSFSKGLLFIRNRRGDVYCIDVSK